MKPNKSTRDVPGADAAGKTGSSSSRDKHPGWAEQIPRNELLAILRSLPATVFRVEKDERGRSFWTFYEGKLAEDLELSTENLHGKDIKEAPARLPDDLDDRIDDALRGEPQEGIDESEGRFFKYYIDVSKDSGGRPGAVYGYVTEITEQKQAERAQEDLHKGLMERNERLAQVTKQTEQLNYTLSHDLRNPLTVILSMCEVMERELRSGAGDPVQRVNKIRQAANRMNELLTDILKLSRSERAAPERRSVEVSTMAHEILRQLAATQPHRHVKVRVRPGMKVYADPNLLRDLLENLLSNAWKYTAKEDEPWIEVAEKKRGGKQWICVQDNGIGFREEEGNDLFIPFKRLQAAQEFHGTGVGLATAKRIVDGHGGMIEATGRPGVGAEFCFTLPDAESAPARPGRGEDRELSSSIYH